MNDDFLTRFRKAPRPEFVSALYKRINSQMKTQKPFHSRRIMLATALGIVLFAALAFSPDVQAAFNSLVRQIGGITFFGPEEIQDQPPVPESEVTIIPEEVLPLAQAIEKLPFAISLPTWVPDGFSMGSPARISYFPNNVTPVYITWYGSDRNVGNIELMIMGQRVSWLVDTESLREVQINNQPAALVGGSWDADSGQWNSESDVSLTWLKGEVTYRLSSPGAAVEDLIRMAESIP